MVKSVKLRDIDRGHDHFDLWATLTEDGDLLIEGQDFGPGTAPVSSDGEYEYSRRVAAAEIPALVELLGLPPGSDLIDQLAASFSGESSWRLEEIISSAGLGELAID